MISNPHSPFPAGPAPSRVSARNTNFAACLFEKVFCRDGPQHDCPVGAFREAPACCACPTHAHTTAAAIVVCACVGQAQQAGASRKAPTRSEEHTSELQSRLHL